MSDLKQAKKQYEEARAAENAIRKEIDDFESDQLRAAKKRIGVEVAKRWGAELERACKSRSEARQQLIVEQDKAALQIPPPYPLGSIFAEWGRQRFAARTQPHKPTGRKAVFEVVTSSTEYPDNWASYSRPQIGEYILRVLKKDGTAGKQVIVTTRGKAHNWLPEGEAPRP